MKVTTEQRRTRLAVRHGLLERADSPETVPKKLVALHATDPATIFLSIHARTHDVATEDIETALYSERTMMRTLAMRRTLFVPATGDDLTIVEASSAPDVAAKTRADLVKGLTATEVPNPDRWLEDAFAEVLAAVDQSSVSRDDQTGFAARTITELVPRLSTKIVMGGGKHTLTSGATSRVLGLMAVEGLLARGRPIGQWTGRQYAWHRRDQWVPRDESAPTADEAAALLLGRYLHRFGPVTIDDCKWWTGWTATKTKRALAVLDTREVELDDSGPAWLMADDTEPVAQAGPWLALLPSLDPTPMGWRDRDWYLGDHVGALFDRNGNIGPTIWADGRIVGGWSQTTGGDIATRLFERLTKPQLKMLDVEVERLKSFVGDTRIKPSFPTPLQKELAEIS